MLNSSMLQHDVAVVTGAAQGNGRAIALGLAQQRAAVAVTDINEAGAEEVTEEIRRMGGRAWATALDVTSSDQCASFAQRVIGELERFQSSSTTPASCAAARWTPKISPGIGMLCLMSMSMAACIWFRPFCRN